MQVVKKLKPDAESNAYIIQTHDTQVVKTNKYLL